MSACMSGGNHIYWKLISTIERSVDLFVSDKLQDFTGPADRCG